MAIDYEDLDHDSDETEEELRARLEEEGYEEFSQVTVNMIIDKVLLVADELSGNPLRKYQVPVARRLVESIIIGDGNTLTALASRQSGKTETMANVIAACMIILPLFSKVFPDLLDKFKKGMWVGCFAPVDDQAEIVYSRIVSVLTGEHALELYKDPDLNIKTTKGHGYTIHLSNGSLVRRQTAHPRSNIEGKTYHLVLIDEAQAVDTKVINKSIAPMLSSVNGSMIMIGTPTYTKSAFYDQIQNNKRNQLKHGKRQSHYQWDWKEVAKENKEYGKFVRQQMLRMGEDSDEFKLAYRVLWLLDKGMFTTQDRIDELGDPARDIVPYYFDTPVVVGIDWARKHDSTVVTVMAVDWDRPDEFGQYDHYVLNWLDLGGKGWETQYAMIVEFLKRYNVLCVGFDAGGLGDVAGDRLRNLLPNVAFVELASDRATQSRRWKNLKEILDRGKISWPASKKTTNLKTYRKFTQQFSDLEIKFEGPYVMAAAPRVAGAFDDYLDSLCLACIVVKDYEQEVAAEAVIMDNPFFRRD